MARGEAGEEVGDVEEGVEKLRGEQRAGGDANDAEDKAEDAGAENGAAALVDVGEAEERGRDEQADPDRVQERTSDTAANRDKETPRKILR